MAVPLKDSLLVPYSTNMNARLVTSGVTIYKLATGTVTAFTALQTAYLAAYNAMIIAREAGDRSESLTATKDVAKQAMLVAARQIYTAVLSNSAISDSDKILLGVHLRVAPSPIPAPSIAPAVDVVSVAARTVTLHLHDSASSSRRGKPAFAKAAYVYSFVGTEYPADSAGWNFEGASTKPRFDILFPSTLAGGTQVWIRCCWVNAKQQAGPMSVPIATTLQGGGAMVDAPLMRAAA